MLTVYPLAVKYLLYKSNEQGEHSIAKVHAATILLLLLSTQLRDSLGATSRTEKRSKDEDPKFTGGC